MNKLPGILVILAAISLVVAVLIKLTTMGKLMPGPIPMSWLKLSGIFLLFSIALSLLGKK